MFKNLYTRLTVCLLSFLTSCLEVQNSFENDENQSAQSESLDLSDPAQARLQKVRDLFVKYNCVECHASRPTGFTRFLTNLDNDWKNDTWGVVKGSTSESKLFNRLKWTGCNSGDCNMPNSGASISNEDMEIFKVWIEQMP